MARVMKVGFKIKCITARDFELMKGISKTGLTSQFDSI